MYVSAVADQASNRCIGELFLPEGGSLRGLENRGDSTAECSSTHLGRDSCGGVVRVTAHSHEPFSGYSEWKAFCRIIRHV